MGSAATIELCSRCRGQLLPEQPRPPLVGDMWRAPADGMVKRETVKEKAARLAADRKKAQKERKANARATLRAITSKSDDAPAALKFFLAGSPTLATAPSDDCPDCLALQSRARARVIARSPRRGNYGLAKAIMERKAL